MTPERAKQLLPFVQAIAEGKKLQWKYIGDWRDIDNFSLDNSDLSRIRVKPEPPEFWIFKDHVNDLYRGLRDRASITLRTPRDNDWMKVRVIE